MNACRLFPCQAGPNSPVGLMKEDNVGIERDRGRRKTESKRVQKLVGDGERGNRKRMSGI